MRRNARSSAGFSARRSRARASRISLRSKKRRPFRMRKEMPLLDELGLQGQRLGVDAVEDGQREQAGIAVLQALDQAGDLLRLLLLGAAAQHEDGWLLSVSDHMRLLWRRVFWLISRLAKFRISGVER